MALHVPKAPGFAQMLKDGAKVNSRIVIIFIPFLENHRHLAHGENASRVAVMWKSLEYNVSSLAY